MVAIFTLIMLCNYTAFIKSKKKRILVRNTLISSIIVIISSSIIWMGYNKSVGSSLVFLAIIYLCFNIALFKDMDKGPSYIRILGKASVFMFAGVVFIVIQALTEGELLEMFEGVLPGDANHNKRK